MTLSVISQACKLSIKRPDTTIIMIINHLSFSGLIRRHSDSAICCSPKNTNDLSLYRTDPGQSQTQSIGRRGHSEPISGVSALIYPQKQPKLFRIKGSLDESAQIPACNARLLIRVFMKKCDVKWDGLLSGHFTEIE